MQTLDLSTATTLVPPARLGQLLVTARDQQGRSLQEIESAAQGRFSAGDLRLLEAGKVAVTDEDIRAVTALYGVDLDGVSRGKTELVIDLHDRELFIGGDSRKFQPGDDDRQIMIRYLSLVYRLRDTKPGTVLPARTGDLDVLATVFGRSPEQVRVALEELMLSSAHEIRERHSFLTSRIIVPAIGVLVALTSAGGLLLTHSTASPAPTAKIGNALFIERPDEPTPSTVVATSSLTGIAEIGEALVITR